MLIAGWREWISLPELHIPQIKTKIDTGARTSALHAFRLEYFQENHIDKVRFFIHPYQYTKKPVIECVSNLKDKRVITDSGGHREERPVIETLFQLNEQLSWLIEITLTSRDDMRFKMLLGRTALKNRILVDANASYLLGKKKIK